MKSILVTSALLLFGNLSIAASQLEQPGDGNGNVGSSSSCMLPKPTVGGINATVYKVGANSWHIPVLDYITELIGPEYDPPISFRRTTANLYLNQPSREESLALGYDFMVANPHVSSCFESEGETVSLANQVVINQDAATGEFHNLTQYGATVYVLKNRTDIQTLADVKGKKIGTNKITNLATQLCYDVLLRAGIHHLQDPKQTIFFRNSDQALAAVLAGEVDVGCAASSVLEKYTDPNTGELLDMSQIRILNPQQHMVDGIPFPFAISSQLVPGYQFAAYPHVDASVKKRVQQELFAMQEHADAAPALLACLEDRGCFTNNTECADECFETLDVGTIRNCDTTAQLALKAYDALQAGNLVGFTEPLHNLRMRDIQETTGFLIKEGFPECVRMKNIVDATTCPSGHFARSSEEIIQECNVTGLECFDRPCICSPCVEAFEVDFFPVTPEDDNEEEASSRVGSGCSKFSVCGTVQQEHVLSFRAIDNKERLNATMTGAFLLADESEDPFVFDNVNGTFHFDFIASHTTAGQKTIKIRINDDEIPESPFRIVVVKRDCAADTGDDRREPDDYGQCVCKSGMVELFDKCVSLAILISCIVGAFLILFLIAVHYYVQKKKEQADNLWKLDPAELYMDDPPPILGRGTFGLVLLAEYRGTPVAVKRILPLKMRNSGTSGSFSEMRESAISVVEVSTDSSPNGHRTGFSSMSSTSVAWARTNRIKEDFLGVFRKRKAARLFVEEIRLLSRLRHPSITTVMGAVISNKLEPMLVMEYMHFGSLHDILHNESMFLDVDVRVGMLQDVANGLRFLHSSDPVVLHGDLKSQNILIDDKLRAKVADFGCGDFGVSLMGSLHSKNHTRGTPYWMAPELLRGDTANTKESDVYAFGIVIYEVFSRKDPYAGEPYDEVLRLVSCKVANKRPPVPDKCPLEAAKMMKKCLDRDPAERPTATGLDLCLGWMDGANVEVCDTTPPQPDRTDTEPTDVLLDQMFPHHIAKALKEGRKPEPEMHDEVTIVLSDIVGYTELASAMSPTKVSDLLNRLYSSFDELCERLDVFKVETVGDSYMTVFNLVKSQPNHAILAARFAIEAMMTASLVPIDTDDESSGFLQLRIGFHTGPVATHVIGTKNARFTLIGDTVNTASQMETNSKPGKIMCSEDSYRLLCKEQYDPAELEIEKRGVIQVNGKVDMVTYWVEGGPGRVESC